MYVLLMKTSNETKVMGTAETEEAIKLAYLAHTKTYSCEFEIVKTFSFDGEKHKKRLLNIITKDVKISTPSEYF